MMEGIKKPAPGAGFYSGKNYFLRAYFRESSATAKIMIAMMEATFLSAAPAAAPA
jgi:hypothetical protein